MATLVACVDDSTGTSTGFVRDSDCHFPAAEQTRATWPEATFASHFTLVSTLSLSAAGDSGFASVRSVDLSRPPNYLILDSRNRNLKIVDTSGMLQK